MKRLLGAIVDGFGLTAGKKLFDEAVDDLVGDEDPAKAAERAKREAETEKQRAAEAKRAAAEAKKREKDRAAEAKRAAAEIDRELAAMKKRIGRGA
jgi:hypothetical protein